MAAKDSPVPATDRPTSTCSERQWPFWRRLWRYQLERFPLHQHAPLVAVFSYSALCFSRLLRIPPGESFTLPGALPATVGFLVCLGFFCQLRIADEFKDYEDDLAHRPYRPVQRGLVRLRELLVIGLGLAVIQGALAFLLHPGLLILLAVCWAYFLLMSREFFVRRWLEGRPVVYMASHMAIMPLVDLFATGCDWVVAGTRPNPTGLGLFLASSYFSGVIIELGRKLRAPDDEEAGVDTYSALWGRRPAAFAWVSVLTVAAAISIGAANYVGFLWPVAIVGALLLVLAVSVTSTFLSKPQAGSGKRFEFVSGAWVIAMYTTLGVIPSVLRAYGG